MFALQERGSCLCSKLALLSVAGMKEEMMEDAMDDAFADDEDEVCDLL